jgi:hypothetical protein
VDQGRSGFLEANDDCCGEEDVDAVAQVCFLV